MSTIPSSDQPIVVAPTPTPFRDDDEQSVDFGALERNVGRWLETPLSGFVVVTANGEETMLSEVGAVGDRSYRGLGTWW